MATFPRFRLYESDGSTLVYEFEKVLDINDFQDPSTFTEHTSLRGEGSIISIGSNEPWDLTLAFLLIEEDYEALVAEMQNVIDSIDKFTKYILKVDTTTGGSTKDYKVKRLTSIAWPNTSRKKRVDFQRGQITFRVDSWA